MSWQAQEEFGNEITVTRRKETVSSKVGLRLNLEESGGSSEQDGSNYLVVTRMAPDSLFADSELAIGMRILSINGLETIDMAAEDATGLIKRIRGDVTLVAVAPAPQPDPEPEPEPTPPTPVTVTRVKEHTASKIGLRLGVSSNGKQLAITKIAPDSIFADSELQPGMIVLSINGLQLHNNENDDQDDDDDDDGGFSAQDATGLIRRVKGNLTIEAVAPPPQSMARHMNDPNDGVSIDTSGRLSVDSNGSGSATGATTRSTTITVSKSSPEQKVGLSLSQSGNGMMITRVDPNGLFGGGRLQPGVRLVSVNNVNVKKLPVPLVRNMIGRVVGELTLIVESSDTTPTTSNNNNNNPSQQLVAPVIEVVNTECMMGNSPQQQPFPGEVVVARPPSQRLQNQPREQARYAVPIEARAYRESARTKVGIRLRCKTDGSVLIDHIAADGLFQHSRLQTGMRLQSVNGVAVTGKPHASVVQMIGQTVGELRLVAAP